MRDKFAIRQEALFGAMEEARSRLPALEQAYVNATVFAQGTPYEAVATAKWQDAVKLINSIRAEMILNGRAEWADTLSQLGFTASCAQQSAETSDLVARLKGEESNG